MVHLSGALKDSVKNEVKLPWSAWYGDHLHTICFPEECQVDVLEPVEMPGWDAQRISAALDTPSGSPSLTELARGARSACVVVDDLARPTKTAELLPGVLRQITAGGISQSAITILVATGTHASLDEKQIALKVGPRTADSCRVKVHDATADLADTGIPYGDRPLRVNRDFLEAEVKVGISTVLPHSFAGYSGGAKLMLPGLSDIPTAARSHKFVQMGLRGGQDPDRNRFRLEIEELARHLGFHYVVCVVPNRRRETAGLFAGDLVVAHRKACALAAKMCATPIKKTYDCIVLNAYPKDIDLIQADNALLALKTAREPAVHDNGIILITTAATQGLGRHGLFEPGAINYRAPQPKRAMGQRPLWLYAPGASEQEARKLHWEGYPFFRDARELTRALESRLRSQAKVGVLPCAPMQQLEEHRTDDQGSHFIPL